MLPEPFEQAKPVLRKLEGAGYQAYYVGGSVRDLLLKRPTNDVDIATSALPEEVKAVFPKTIDVGIEHGTVVVIFKETSYEVTTFRSEEEYKDYRRPESVTFITSLKEDLQRRDFTINAIAMDSCGTIHDPFQGEEDIKAGILRTVGSANDRFKEDALRMMRAVRFIAQLDFVMDKETFESIQENGRNLQYIAIERLTAEFEKLLSGSFKEVSLRAIERTGLYQYLPGLKDEGQVIETAASLSVNHLTNEQMWVLMLHLSKDSENFLHNWRLPTKKTRYLSKTHSCLVEKFKEEWSAYSLYLAGLPAARDAEAVYSVITNKKAGIQEIERIYDGLPIKNRSQLDLTGNDLMQWTDTPGGPWIRETIERAEQGVINGLVPNEKTAIREWLGFCNHQ